MIQINIGDLFGDFIIDNRNYKVQQDRHALATYWDVHCQYCGKIKTLRGDAVRKNPKCICQYKNAEIGKIYGDWKILEPTNDQAIDGCFIYKCQCIHCNYQDYIATNVLRGQKKFCPICHQKKTSLIDLTGQTFGYLEVLERDMSEQHTGHERDSYWICKCHRCGSIKSVRGISLRQDKVHSCGCIRSLGEENIAKILTINNIPFEKEYRFKDLYFKNSKSKLSFDFAIFDNNHNLKHLLEYDGQQHFQEGVRDDSGWNTYDNFLLTSTRDNLKNQYCIAHNIPLIRIKYNESITLNKLLGLEPTEGGCYGIK